VWDRGLIVPAYLLLREPCKHRVLLVSQKGRGLNWRTDRRRTLEQRPPGGGSGGRVCASRNGNWPVNPTPFEDVARMTSRVLPSWPEHGSAPMNRPPNSAVCEVKKRLPRPALSPALRAFDPRSLLFC
jgi:hypothetical protein